MTRGSKGLAPNASIYDRVPILLMERFAWSEREAVLASINRVLAAGSPAWTFGGAYVYWAQKADRDGGGTVLYVGEAHDLATRHGQHLVGGTTTGNKFAELSAYFAVHPDQLCGLGLMVVLPGTLDWMFPPDEKPVLMDDARKRAGEELEGLLLRASKNVFGASPLLNGRNDASRFRHGDDVVRFQSLVRFLLDHPEASADFSTFELRADETGAIDRLRAAIQACDALRS